MEQVEEEEEAQMSAQWFAGPRFLPRHSLGSRCRGTWLSGEEEEEEKEEEKRKVPKTSSFLSPLATVPRQGGLRRWQSPVCLSCLLLGSTVDACSRQSTEAFRGDYFWKMFRIPHIAWFDVGYNLRSLLGGDFVEVFVSSACGSTVDTCSRRLLRRS